jgi:hypothetical protein
VTWQAPSRDWIVSEMSRSEDQASEAARLLARLVRDRALLPDQDAVALKRMVGHSLAAPSTAARRWDNLALLVKLIVERDGLTPAPADYEAARASSGAQAPPATTLTGRYGSWMRALTAATRLIHVEPAPDARSERHHWRPPYRPIECAAAIARFHRQFGTWPSRTEYAEWARISRRAARACGAPDPNLPGDRVVVRHYGTFDRAAEAAKAIYGEEG